MKKHSYKVGDYVTILRPNFIDRVGYTLRPKDLIEEVEKDPRYLKILEDFNITSSRVKGSLLHALAFQLVRDRNFGGDERKIFYIKDNGDTSWFDPSYVDYFPRKAQIYGKQIRKTGTRYAPNSGYDSYDGEYYNEPGGLDNPKTHVILETSFGLIEDIDVEPYKEI